MEMNKNSFESYVAFLSATIEKAKRRPTKHFNLCMEDWKETKVCGVLEAGKGSVKKNSKHYKM